MESKEFENLLLTAERRTQETLKELMEAAGVSGEVGLELARKELGRYYRGLTSLEGWDDRP